MGQLHFLARDHHIWNTGKDCPSVLQILAITNLFSLNHQFMLAPFVLNPLFSTGRVIRMTGCSQLPWCSAAYRSCQRLLFGRMAMLPMSRASESSERWRKHSSLIFNTNKRWRSGHLHILCTVVFKLKSRCFLSEAQPNLLHHYQHYIVNKSLKLRSGIHWAVTSLKEKWNTCYHLSFCKQCDCFGWCTKQTRYYFINFTVQEFAKRHPQIPNLGFLKRCIF